MWLLHHQSLFERQSFVLQNIIWTSNRKTRVVRLFAVPPHIVRNSGFSLIVRQAMMCVILYQQGADECGGQTGNRAGCRVTHNAGNS